MFVFVFFLLGALGGWEGVGGKYELRVGRGGARKQTNQGSSKQQEASKKQASSKKQQQAKARNFRCW
jgi:hypothetical protein